MSKDLREYNVMMYVEEVTVLQVRLDSSNVSAGQGDNCVLA